MFYKRNILGEWVIAEGAIYDMFIESENTYDEILPIDYFNNIIVFGYHCSFFYCR